MNDETLLQCVLLPCSATENWAVPQNCLAEILTLQSSSEQPPEEVNWRGRQLPVLDFGAEGAADWSERRRGSGLLAIFLGLKGEGCEYWGVAIRGAGLAVASLSPERVEDAPDAVVEHATAAFRYEGVLYQVPDLDGLQKKLATQRQVA